MTRLVFIVLFIAALSACADGQADQDVLTPYEDGAQQDVGDAGTEDSGDAGDDADNNAANNNSSDAGDTGDGDADANGDGGDINNGDGFCQPQGDGVMRRDRYPVDVGQGAPFQFSFDVAVDTAGDDSEGTRTWDFSADGGDDDRTETIRLEDPQEHWFGDVFEEATYATKLSGDPDVEEFGLFAIDDQGLFLLGVASADDGYYRTELTYDPPVTILEFPFEEGDSWSTETDATGSFGGNHFHSHEESYATTVDAKGQVLTPYGSFEALRVNTMMDRGYWGAFGWTTAEVRTYAFVAECFGTVARVVSAEDEAQPDFDEAAELMRLAQ